MQGEGQDGARRQVRARRVMERQPRSRLASRSGSVQAPLAQSVGHVAPGSAQDTPSAQDAAQAGPQHDSLQHDSQVLAPGRACSPSLLDTFM